MARIALSALALTLAAVVARGWLVYPELPDTVASHFGPGGRADGWSSKGSFFTLLGAVVALLGALGFGLPLLVGVLPSSLVNLPHREHWLAPERLAETRAALRAYLAWFLVGTLVLIGFVLELTYGANLRAAAGGVAELGGGALAGFGAYLLFTAVWLGLFLRRFSRPAGAPPELPPR